MLLGWEPRLGQCAWLGALDELRMHLGVLNILKFHIGLEMKGVRRLRAVSPVIATLLLIAIAVAAGIILYVFVSGFTQSLTTANPAQAGENLAMTKYDASDVDPKVAWFVTLRNTGPAALRIAKVSFNNVELPTATPVCPPVNNFCATGAPYQLTITSGREQEFTLTGHEFPELKIAGVDIRVGQSYVLTIITESGARFQFILIAGRRS